MSTEVRALIFRMASENPTWRAPHIHWELRQSHGADGLAMDFFTVPMLTFGVLYCFFVISHGRRKILRCQFTRNASGLWIVQQMRQAWS